MKLNSQTFNWPGRMDPIFEVSQKRLVSKREKAENEVKERVQKFEELLVEYQNEVDTYKEKEVSRNSYDQFVILYFTPEDIRAVVEQLAELSKKLESSKEEAMVI